MIHEFTDLNLDKYNNESETFGCSRCSLMMSIIDDRLSSFFRDVNNKIKGLEKKVESLDQGFPRLGSLRGCERADVQAPCERAPARWKSPPAWKLLMNVIGMRQPSCEKHDKTA